MGVKNGLGYKEVWQSQLENW